VSLRSEHCAASCRMRAKPAKKSCA